MRKAKISPFLIPLLLAGLAVPLNAKSDESQAGTYGSESAGQPGVEGQQQQPGIGGTDALTPTSTAEKGDLNKGPLHQEGLAFQPLVGMMNYRSADGTNTSNRATYGLVADANVARFISEAPELYIGPQVGFVFSHLGPANAGFFGATPDNQALNGSPGANSFYFPTDLKVGYNMGNFRPSIHAGANLFYTSVASSIGLGATPDTGSDANWSYLPNVGIDLEYAVAKNFAIVARPDLTFGGSFPIWQASVGASIPMG